MSLSRHWISGFRDAHIAIYSVLRPFPHKFAAVKISEGYEVRSNYQEGSCADSLGKVFQLGGLRGRGMMAVVMKQYGSTVHGNR